MFYARGMNYYNVDLKGTSIHAEVDAMNNLKHPILPYPKVSNIKKEQIIKIEVNNG